MRIKLLNDVQSSILKISRWIYNYSNIIMFIFKCMYIVNIIAYKQGFRNFFLSIFVFHNK